MLRRPGKERGLEAIKQLQKKQQLGSNIYLTDYKQLIQ